MKKSIGAKPFAYTTPVWVVGTYDKDGKPNVMTASWGGICCSSPPCVCVSLREATYSHSAMKERKAFTVSIPSEAHAREADYFGIASGRAEDKFAVAGLTAARSEIVDAPYVMEFPIILECKVLHIVEIGLHTQFIGEVVDIKADDSVLGEDGMPELTRVKPFIFDPGRRDYYGVGGPVGKAFSMGKELGGTKK